jgi:hypothetical protein
LFNRRLLLTAPSPAGNSAGSASACCFDPTNEI